MPLYRVTLQRPLNRKLKPREGRRRWKEKDGAIASLGQLCLRSLAENMKTLWVKDYAENYMDQYNFRHIMGPFSELRESRLKNTLSAWSVLIWCGWEL